MQAATKIAVAGATGRVGRHVVDVLEQRGYEVAEIARSRGVDVITGEGLSDALDGVGCVIDVSTGPSPEQRAATEFFTASTRNLQQAGRAAGVERIVGISIIGADRFTAGYGAAKVVHEQAMLSGPIPTQVVRAAQFHEFVSQMMEWGTRDDVVYLPRMRTQLVAASTVAELLADLATTPGATFTAGSLDAPLPEIAGPARGGPGRHGESARRHSRGLGADRSRQRPGGSRRRSLRIGRAAAGPERHAGGSDVRGVAEGGGAGAVI